MPAAAEVLFPSSPAEAAELFGDGDGVTVVAGGTIVLPTLHAQGGGVEKALLLTNAGLAGVSRDGATVTIGAGTVVEELVALGAPLGPCAANVADGEIRAQATLGGNVCAGPGHDAPRGDLQGALLALGAVARSAGAGGETTEPLEDFLGKRDTRLLLDVSYDEPEAGAFAAIEYPHTHEYTVLAVSGARAADGTVRLAATGIAGHGCRLPGAEAAADVEAAAAASVADASLADDALASAWYREQTLPVLVRRVLTALEEAR